MGYLKRMQKILRKPETIVLLAWSITFTAFLFGGWLASIWLGPSGKIFIPYLGLPSSINAYFASLVVILASIATTLALGLKKFLPAFLLALPGGLFMWLALVAAVFSCKFTDDERPIVASMLFFPFCAIGGSLLIRSFKDEGIRRKIYLGALLLMVLLAATALAFLLISLIV